MGQPMILFFAYADFSDEEAAVAKDTHPGTSISELSARIARNAELANRHRAEIEAIM